MIDGAVEPDDDAADAQRARLVACTRHPDKIAD